VAHILIYGGTFDPPHIGHVQLAKEAMEFLGCDTVLFIPASENPLKKRALHTSAQHRLAMLTLALVDADWAEISEIELRRGGKSYTIDTLESLQTEYPEDTRFTMLIGTDQAVLFEQWHRYQDIEAIATIAVVSRRGIESSRFNALPLDEIDISSTMIRACVQQGKPIDTYVDGRVHSYISEHNLYK
jgi:nicotinate-nucleotide adenylyltransferase